MIGQVFAIGIGILLNNVTIDPEAIREEILYNNVIKHLKKHEGFRDEIYLDNDGSPTIGYGHHILEGETFSTPITEYHATALLKKDLDKRVLEIEKATDLTGNKSLALGLLAYNMGVGKVKHYIDKYNLLCGDNINKILNYCHYKVNRGGKQIVLKSKSLEKRRQFELAVYNYKS